MKIRVGKRHVMGVVFVLAAVFVLWGGFRAPVPAAYPAHLAAGRALAAHDPAVSPPAYRLFARLAFALQQAGGDELVMAAGLAGLAGIAALAWPLMTPLGNGLSAAAALLLFGWLTQSVSALSTGVAEMLAVLLFQFFLTRKRSWVSWGALIFVEWLWAGSGLYFLLGPAMAAVAVIARGIEEPRGTAVPSSVDVRWEGLACALLAAAPLFHAKGAALWSLGVNAWAADNQAAVAGYWFSPLEFWISPGGINRLILAALVIAASTLVLCRRKLPVFQTTMAVLAGLLMLRSYAALPLAAALLVPFLSLSFQVLIEGLEQRLVPAAQNPSHLMIGAVGILTAVSVAAAVTGSAGAVHGLPASVARDDFHPSEALQFMREAGMPRTWFVLPMDGGAVQWALPGAEVFADARPGLQHAERLSLLARASGGENAALDALFGGRTFDGALIDCLMPGSAALLRRLQFGPEWGLAYFDGRSAVYLSRQATPPALRQNPKWHRYGVESLEAEVRRLTEARAAGRSAFSVPAIGALNFFHAIQRFEPFESLSALLRPLLSSLRPAAPKETSAAPPAAPAASSGPNLPGAGALPDGTLPLPGRPR